MRGVVRTRFRKAGSIAAGERGAFDAGGRAAADPCREAFLRNIQTRWPAKQMLVARACCEKDRADIDASGLCDRRSAS